MDEDQEPELVVDASRVRIIAHLLIKDRDTGQVLVNKRDHAIQDRDLKNKNGKPA